MMHDQKTVLQRCHGVAHLSERGVRWNQKIPCKHRIAPFSTRMHRRPGGKTLTDIPYVNQLCMGWESDGYL